MNKQLLLTLLLAITIILSVSATSASEVNVTDSYTTNLVDDMSDVSVPMENTADSSVLSVSSDSNVDNDSSKVSLSSEEVLESENSNTLSTNSDNNDLSAGEGNLHFAAYSDEIELKAISKSKTIVSSDLTKYYHGTGSYKATFYDINGNLLKDTDVLLTLNNKNYTRTTNSKGVVTLGIGLKAGTYKITAYNPVTKYSLTNAITVLSTINAKDLSKYYKGSAKYTATFLDTKGKLLGNTDVQLTVNGKTYSVKTNSKGVASLGIGLYPGTYKMTAKNPVNNETITTSIKVLSTISAKDLTKYYKGSAMYTATFRDVNGNLLSNKDVQLTINGKTYSVKTDSKGVASLGIGLYPGTYKMTAKNPVNGETITTSIKVLSTISAKDLTKYYKGSAKYTATFRDVNGNLLSNKDVQLTINGKTYTVKTDSKGVGSLAIGLYPGTYQMTAKNPVNGETVTTNIKVLTTINATDITKVVTDGRLFYATFLNGEGKPLAKQSVSFKINGQTYTRTTDANGLASLSLGTLRVGTYSIVSSNVDGLTKTNTVKVVASTSSKLVTSNYTFFTTDTKTIKVTLLNGLGYAPGSGRTVTMKVDGKTYTSKADSNGDVKFTLSSLGEGEYTATYSFAGDSYYSASSATGKIIVIKNKVPTFTVKSDTTFIKGADNKFQVALTLNGEPVAGKTVTFKVNGVSYAKTTDKNGIASLPIGLAVGKYTITYTNKADSQVDSITKSTSITINDKSTSKITWKSGTSFNQGSQTYKVLLQDSNNKALSGKVVKLTVNSKTYSNTTSSSGYAIFNVNLPAGNYSVSFSFAGDNAYAKSSGSKKIQVVKNYNVGYGYWLFGGDMKNVNLNTLASQGTTDIFLNFYAITAHGQSAVETWIASANKLGIRVHIWMQSFYDGSWINPVKDGSMDTDFFNQKIDEAKKYASIKGVSGIHLDYLRYPGTAYKTTGGTEAISEFTRLMAEAIHSINSNLIVSCALMPETTNNIKYYGQDISAISQYVDVVVPMMYKGNYNSGTSWISTTTKWFIDNSKGAQVWAGLQGYKSDKDVTKLSSTEITNDAKVAINANAAGVVIFRWGVTNFVNFNSLNDTTSAPSVSIADIVTGANTIKTYYANNNKLPDSVTVGGVKFTMPEFLYLMSQAIYKLGNSDTSAIEIVSGIAAAKSPSGDAIKANLNKADYLTVANNIATYIISNKQAPNYVSSVLGKLSYPVVTEAFARIVAFYGNNNNQLPNYVTINSEASTSLGAANKISIADIVTGANTIKTYYANNNKLPDSVTVGGVKFTMPEFLYMMSQAIYQLGDSNTSDIEIVSGVAVAKSPSGDAISANLNKADYLTAASDIVTYIKSNNQAPNYASSTLGKLSYSVVTEAFARVVAFYGNNNNQLPNYVTIKSSEEVPVPEKVSIAEIVTGAANLKTYYEKNSMLPDTVTVSGYKFTMQEFLYLMSQAIYQLGNSNMTDIDAIYGVSAVSSPSGDVISANLNKTDYLTVANNIAKYIRSNNQAPNYASSTLGKLSYPIVSEAFGRVLAFYGNNNQLPNYVTIKSTGSESSSSTPSTGAEGNGLNEKNTIENLDPYLLATKNCQVNDSAIKSVVDSLISGLTTDYAKAEAIYNYVRDAISYSFYYDTKYGATGTLTYKTGNCVDQSHLLIAMFRTAGLPARYVHGTCRFTSATYGHVWAQVLIGDSWVVADATSSRNSFGNIVNWNTNSFTLHSINREILF